MLHTILNKENVVEHNWFSVSFFLPFVYSPLPPFLPFLSFLCRYNIMCVCDSAINLSFYGDCTILRQRTVLRQSRNVHS